MGRPNLQDIRFAVASRTYSEVEEEDLQLAVDWADSADSASLSSMSAVCYLYARWARLLFCTCLYSYQGGFTKNW